MSEKLSRIVNHPSFTPVCVSIVSAGIGMGVGYILGRRHPTTVHVIPEQRKPINYEELEEFLADVEGKEETNDEEIVVPAPPHPGHSSGRVVSGAEMVAQTIKREMTKTHHPEPDVVSEAEFAASDEQWNYDKEVASRNSTQPYVIHYDEYFAKENEDSGYLQQSLTFYEGDEIMVDQEDVPLYKYAEIVGELKWGHGSNGDPEVFYVRNDKLKAEYEICRHPGSFEREVLGLGADVGERPKKLAHSRVDKFKPDD